MRKLVKEIYRILENSNLYYRKFILVTFDQLIIYVSLLISFFIEGIFINNPVIFFLNYYHFFILTLFIYLLTGQYQALTKYFYSSSIYKIGIRSLLIGFSSYFLNLFPDFFNKIPLNLIILSLLISTVLSFWFRTSLSWLIKIVQSENKKSINVVIFGAGSAGAQLISTLKYENNFNVVCFIDENKKLWGRSINSIPIKSPNFLYKTNFKIDKILLAIPSVNLTKKQKILKELSNHSIPVYKIPSIQELISGKEKIDTLKPITTEELLGREPVKPMLDLISKGIKDINICITGAGGSIGSELCRQIINFSPSKLVLIDNSEANLYQIGIDLKNKKNFDFPLVLKLGDCTNKKLINSIFKEHNIDMVFHAAAYKHVPIVEENPLPGIFNNVISTLSVCEASLENNLKRMILISTDKAVRPTNVMGASKRLAEQIVLDFANNQNNFYENEPNIKTCFSLVRFGNVLGSSGSVVPLFSKQIREGGPITITDKKIIRYFMTLKEAAQLVLHVAGISKGGEVFLLDMGEPVSIQKLAELMIKLSGSTIKVNQKSAGGIEIKYTGLRPGEKLYEELLIDSNAEKTDHPLIFKGVNENRFCTDLLVKVNLLKEKIDNLNEDEAFKILRELVPDWKSLKG